MKRNLFRMATLLVALVMVSLGSVKAQEAGDMAAGANVGIATGGGLTNFGIGGKFQYNVTDQIRGEGLFTYYLGDFKYWDLSVNAHYLFGIPDVPQLNVYPLAGLSLCGFGGGSGDSYWEYFDSITGQWVREYLDDNEDGGSSTTLGLNLGGGANYKLTDQLYFNAELKYRIELAQYSTNMFMISVGVAYKF